ncbi:mannose/fructose/N-acetylgalactosamine-specific phosphotransferase system component IID [Microbacterium marinum]|uniref:Mannose/fructose/N-acetylgalactosamine-specific phosphotransferase system component IID n=1 Tax=Microbacterium marinum TaxID=421115 RepID=A0A7W7BP45_9MICO|nr:hypothetical protein [Microbacterium marinum]MBB4666257.1 mannose/fructose/N-acetylgalactosamine-specific phosphotransferase system component IID [Microbacterium marinum]
MQRTTVWSWLVGGVLLVAQTGFSLAGFGIASDGDAGAPLAGLGAALCTLSACLVYAFGLRAGESAVAGRPAGVALLLGLGALSVFQAAWWAGPRGYGSGIEAALTAAAGGVVAYVLAFAAAVYIVRVGVIPAPWSWIPLAAVTLGLGLAAFFALVVPVVSSNAAGGAGVLPATIPALVGVVSIVLSVTTSPAAPRRRVSTVRALPQG